MNIYGAGEVRRNAVIQPVVVSEPLVGFCNRNKLTCAFVVESKCGLSIFVENLLDSRCGLKEPLYICDSGLLIDVDMSDLMIGYCEGPACPRVQDFESEF